MYHASNNQTCYYKKWEKMKMKGFFYETCCPSMYQIVSSQNSVQCYKIVVKTKKVSQLVNKANILR